MRLIFTVGVLALPAVLAHGQSKTVLDGAYTESQAVRGEAAYQMSCGGCHGETLDGRAMGALRGQKFLDRWREESLQPLFDHIRTRMPADAAGSLSGNTYLDILAFILKVNTYPAGPMELTADTVAAFKLVGKDGPKPLPSNTLAAVIGCLTRGPEGAWIVGNATEPVRTRNADEITGDEKTRAAGQPFGNQEFQLGNLEDLPPSFNIGMHLGHRIEVKGVLLRRPDKDRINVLALDSVGATCTPATGDQRRTYIFPGTEEPIPYRLFVPSHWNPQTKMPLLVVLHAGDSLDLPFQRGEGMLEKVAEQRGYIVVVPMGYHADPRPVYNSPFEIIRASRPQAGAAPASTPPPSTALEHERSEQDVLQVTDLVAKEYNADSSRIYLTANSFAGAGVWYLAEKYPQRWAAVAVSSAPISPDGYPFERLRNVPLLVVHGEADNVMSFDAAQTVARVAKQRGVDAEWLPVKNGTHLEAWTTAFSQMLDFFDKHRKQ